MQAFRSYHATLKKSDIIKATLRNTGFLANESKIYLEFCTKSTWPKTEIIETCIAYDLKDDQQIPKLNLVSLTRPVSRYWEKLRRSYFRFPQSCTKHLEQDGETH